MSTVLEYMASFGLGPASEAALIKGLGMGPLFAPDVLSLLANKFVPMDFAGVSKLQSERITNFIFNLVSTPTYISTNRAVEGIRAIVPGMSADDAERIARTELSRMAFLGRDLQYSRDDPTGWERLYYIQGPPMHDERTCDAHKELIMLQGEGRPKPILMEIIQSIKVKYKLTRFTDPFMLHPNERRVLVRRAPT